MIKKHSKKPIKVNKKCFFCESEVVPHYTETTVLGKYLSERGKLVARSKTGLCGSHQRKVEVSVKKARFMALLPFVVRA